jgi:hypothetical protein
VSLTWTAPASDGGSPIDYYIINTEMGSTDHSGVFYADSVPINETIWRLGVELPANQNVLTATITGLAYLGWSLDFNGNYRFTVTAHNTAGSGQQSDPAIVDPYTTPYPVNDIDAGPGNGQVHISWDLHDEGMQDGGSDILYQIIYQDGVDIMHVDPTVFNATITGLTNGHVYNFSVARQNAAGHGALMTNIT